ncbi:MAG: PhnD/SsuA/transferrin family substrate-binding protein [Candidatus Latescibacteria bacterium]|jgi:ABC-type phosphate/phosphonate transport system substrate-binding protein|nr:PhnD/SsuA/transferrin family substrate-binding protein [Candidatus Latescibacterota bacterium]
MSSVLRASLSVLAVVLAVGNCPGQAPIPPGKTPEVIRVGYSGGLFPTVSRKDIQVAVELWAKQMTADLGRPVSPKILFYDDLQSLLASLAAGNLDVASMTSVEYLASANRPPLEPFVVGTVNGRTEEEYVLLTHQSRTGISLSDLRGRKLIVEGGRQGNPLMLIWLEALLLRDGLGTIDAFFGGVEKADKTSQAVMAVFFGRADACLVTRRLYATAVELNPQLGKDLVLLVQSPGLLSGVVCFPASVAECKREIMEDGIFAMSTNPKGRQILTIFGLDGFAPYEPVHLEATRRLVREHTERARLLDGGGSEAIGSDDRD